MDITVLFKACIKTIKTRNRAFGESTTESDKRILSPRHGKCELTMRSRAITQQITRLGDFLAEHRKAYLNFSNHLSYLPEMTDFERDKIDTGAQRIINVCSNAINEFDKELSRRQNLAIQHLEHHQMVVHLMKEYLKQVCKMYSEQKAIRFQRTVNIKKMSRINSNSMKKVNPVENGRQPESNSTASAAGEAPSDAGNEALSPEELQMFELENNQLYNELNCLTDAIQQIESKVVEITKLQEIFTEKVLEQDKDIDMIAATVIGTTENVKDANELIRKAIQRNAGLRVWILFFLIVISFSLLFLDWYND